MSKSKIKQIPEDFSVEELTETVPLNHGDFSLYLLKKKGSTTPDALLRIQKAWKLDSRHMSFGGLKDKHASTTQFFSIISSVAGLDPNCTRIQQLCGYGSTQLKIGKETRLTDNNSPS